MKCKSDLFMVSSKGQVVANTFYNFFDLFKFMKFTVITVISNAEVSSSQNAVTEQPLHFI